ncbi:uncharacterized protein LOC101864514 [Aplysia californica]|uniref:CDAN1-interacting nuclease 1 n=1 Tax=Aplysia californica TaxID=6500 RepID=A0ABM0JIH9_APLCA|nr:uncharacterized protein LOC101864514 [Aplysia californica]
MKQEVYDAVLEILSRKPSFNEGILVLRKTYPNIVKTVGEKTLRSIQAQYYVRRMRRFHYHHYRRETREKYYKLYKEAKSRSEEHVIARLAAKNDISPCLLARIILEEYYLNDVYHVGRERGEGRSALPPGVMTDCFRDIAKLPNPELAAEIYETTMLDNFYGPAVDSIKKTCGAEYEIILQSHCLRAGLSFIDEDQMRDEGFDKTPDIKLKIPIMINKRVVNWIESKASFGDPINHEQYTIDQFLPYKNRFGSGAVIYWFGFVDELADNGERGILLLDHFPKAEDIVQLKDVLEKKPKFNFEHTSETVCEPTAYEEDEDDRFYNYVDPMFDSDCEFYDEETGGESLLARKVSSVNDGGCQDFDKGSDSSGIVVDACGVTESADVRELSLDDRLQHSVSFPLAGIVTEDADSTSRSEMAPNSCEPESASKTLPMGPEPVSDSQIVCKSADPVSNTNTETVHNNVTESAESISSSETCDKTVESQCECERSMCYQESAQIMSSGIANCCHKEIQEGQDLDSCQNSKTTVSSQNPVPSLVSASQSPCYTVQQESDCPGQLQRAEAYKIDTSNLPSQASASAGQGKRKNKKGRKKKR